MTDTIPVPSDSLIYVGDGSFEAIGQEFVDIFIKYGDLKPDQRVLDIGCGIGRMARPLAKYLSAQAEYRGFDIVKNAIEWCQREITGRFPNFEFQFIDVFNGEYNPHGQLNASSISFPYDSAYFDFASLTSVFTHMLPADIDHYLSEIWRVLKPGGRCLMTFFLLTPESRRRLLEPGAGYVPLSAQRGSYACKDESVPEKAIAHDEQLVRNLFQKHNLELEQIHLGAWCGRHKFLTFQDVIVIHKAG